MVDYNFPIHLFREIGVIEKNSSFYYLLLESRNCFISSIKFDVLSWRVLNTIARPFKLAAFIMAYSLLRYKDVIKLDLGCLLTGITQTIIQSKTENSVIIKPLCNFLPADRLADISSVFPFYHSYNKLSYAIRKASNDFLGNSMINHNSATHLFRYFRTCASYHETNSFKSAQIFLGHKEIKATKFYMPSKLMDIYINHL